MKKIWKRAKGGKSPKPPQQPISPGNPADIPTLPPGFPEELDAGPQGRDRRHRGY